MVVYNADKLIRLQVYKTRISVKFDYVERKVGLFKKTKVEGVAPYYYPSLNSRILTEEELADNNLFVKDKQVYLYPKVVLNFEGGFEKTYWFRSDDDAFEFANEIKRKYLKDSIS